MNSVARNLVPNSYTGTKYSDELQTPLKFGHYNFLRLETVPTTKLRSLSHIYKQIYQLIIAFATFQKKLHSQYC
jgi:hypothetical protein